MRRVLHLIAQYPDRTGSGTYMKSILKEGKKSGLSQAAVYAVNDGDEVDLSEYDLSGEYVVRFNTKDLPFPVVGMSDNMPYESTKYLDMTENMIQSWKSAFLSRLRLAVEEFDPDVIYSHHLWLLTALVANEIEGIPVRAFGHGTDIRQFKNKSLGELEYIARGCRRLEKVFALTEHQREAIVDCYRISSENVKVIGGGFDMEIFNVIGRKRSELNHRKKRIIYAGKLCETKGLKSLLRVYGQLEMEAELILAGSGEICERREIERLAQAIGNGVSFVGHLSQGELSKLFKSSDVFVLPSFYEGLALVNVEALASGLRVVSSDIDGISDYMGEEINRSGLIEYVELPKEGATGNFSEEELLKYEERLRKSIEVQLKRRNMKEDLKLYSEVYKSIESKAWSEIFKKL